ncbi:hypothetical protein [Methylobacterium oxalidis]|uniref:hypothetical protein n=1 Tax=Methylobacterium oxalidis TaxID=944322 RepID=UPI003314CD80
MPICRHIRLDHAADRSGDDAGADLMVALPILSCRLGASGRHHGPYVFVLRGDFCHRLPAQRDPDRRLRPRLGVWRHRPDVIRLPARRLFARGGWRPVARIEHLTRVKPSIRRHDNRVQDRATISPLERRDGHALRAVGRIEPGHDRIDPVWQGGRVARPRLDEQSTDLLRHRDRPQPSDAGRQTRGVQALLEHGPGVGPAPHQSSGTLVSTLRFEDAVEGRFRLRARKKRQVESRNVHIDLHRCRG